MLVYYSIGNFISHQVNLDQLVGGMAEITVERNNAVISITNAKLAPATTLPFTSSATTQNKLRQRIQNHFHPIRLKVLPKVLSATNSSIWNNIDVEIAQKRVWKTKR